MAAFRLVKHTSQTHKYTNFILSLVMLATLELTLSHMLVKQTVHARLATKPLIHVEVT